MFNMSCNICLYVLAFPRQRELSKSFEGRIKQLQQELSAAKTEVNRVESSMADALSAKNSEIETLVSSLDAVKKQAALSEGNMASLQVILFYLLKFIHLYPTPRCPKGLLSVTFTNPKLCILRKGLVLLLKGLRKSLLSFSWLSHHFCCM